MIRDDYLMRMLEEFIPALIRVLLNRQGEQSPVTADLETLASTHLGLSLTLLKSLPVPDIQRLFTSSGEPDYMRLCMAAELLRAAYEISGQSEKNDQAAAADYAVAMRLYAAALPLIKDMKSETLSGHLLGIMDRIRTHDFPPAVLVDVFRLQAAAGNTAAAAEILGRLANDGCHNIDAEARIFYQGLLDAGDDAVRAGNLDRREIADRLARLFSSYGPPAA